MINPENIENPERDLDLATRDQKGGKTARGDTLGQTRSAADELLQLRHRIAIALTTTPKDDIPHCGDCYRRGWAAALRSLET